jgi:hypothetical protein
VFIYGLFHCTLFLGVLKICTKIHLSALPFFFIITLSFSALAEDITEPESFLLVNSWLSSEPQPGADHHVIRVCKDDEMIEDCTQCIYKANSDGAVHIPTYNRCVFRTYQWESYYDEVEFQAYNLYWQVKAVSAEGPESEWTEPKGVLIRNHIINESDYCSAVISVKYNF